MSFTIGGIEMSSLLILAAGVVKNPKLLDPYLHPDAPLGAVVSGSYTLNACPGNDGQMVWPASLGELMYYGYGLNAFGMPNMGIELAAKLFPPNPIRPHIVSIAGFNAGEYAQMLLELKGHPHIAGVELNGGCPNTGHLPVAYSLKDLEDLLDMVSNVAFMQPLWLKLSPYMTAKELTAFAVKHPRLNFSNTPTVEPGFVEKLCELLMEYWYVLDAVVMTNTLPSVSCGDALMVISAHDGSTHQKGGLSGPILLEHNLKLVQQMQVAGLKGEIDIIGCGGVLSGDDALSYLQAGCSGVACASGPHWSGGAKSFQDLILGSDGLQNYLSQHQ